MSYPHWVLPDERKIIDRILEDALARDYKVSVFDGEAWSLNRSRNIDMIRSEIAATDVTTLKIRDRHDEPVGSILLVHGNGADVVCDYSSSLRMEELMQGYHQLWETLV